MTNLTKVLIGILAIVSLFLARELFASDFKMIRPFDDSQGFRVSGRYGENRNHVQGGVGYSHTGVDYVLAKGTQVLAAENGVIEFFGDGGKYGYGWLAIIDHGNGLKTYYAHLSRQWRLQGMSVRKGELIGEVGDTGNSKGAHLHWELRKDGKPVNPWFLLAKS